MQQDTYEDTNVYSPEAIQRVQTGLNVFMARVYGWMTLGLIITAVVAMATVQSESLRRFVFGTKYMFMGLLIGEVLLVIALGAIIERISSAVAMAMFIVYAGLNGLTLSVVFLVYTSSSVASTFFVTAAMFGAMSAFGLLTKRDLSGIGGMLMMALVGLVIASVVNLIWANDMLYWIVTYAGVVIFVGLTAYDTQKIKVMALSLEGGQFELQKKAAIMGALKLYLDFINLLLLLLRLLGRRR